jgi:hypothetical protein
VDAEFSSEFLVYRFVKRKVFLVPGNYRNAFYIPVGNSEALANHKARLHLNGSVSRFRQKVGSISSGGRVAQTVQAAGTVALPGNISAIRSPARSGVSRALTPGLPGVPGGNVPGPNERGYRCAEGFQFGGRFTDENYSTCGKQLFDIPSLRETLGQALFRTKLRRARTPRPGEGQGAVLSGQQVDEDSQLMITRALRVSEVGEKSDKAREDGIASAVQATTNQDSDASVLVRRDGFQMVPVITIAELRKVPDNRNMEDAAFIKSVRSAEELGGEELGLLSNTGVTTLVYTTPNGVQIRVDRTRDLSTGERRQLGKDANTASEMSVTADPLARLNFIIENTDGAFKLSKNFGDVDDPEGEGKNGLPNWAVGAFIDQPEPKTEETVDLAEGDEQQPEVSAEDVTAEENESTPSPGSGEVAATVAPPPLEERIDSLKEAVEHLNSGGMISEISPSIVMDALKRSDRYKETKLANDITLYESDQDGRRVLLKQNNEDFEHIAAHFSGETLRNLGVSAPAVRFAGSGDNRPYYFKSPDDVIEGAEDVGNYDRDSAPLNQVLGVQVADWLTDTRDRNDSSLFNVISGEDKVDIVASYGPLSANIGLDEEELEGRRNLALEVFFETTKEAYGFDLTSAEESQKELTLRILDSLIARAQEFSWADYSAKLEVDGSLTDAEKRHLEIVREIFDSRLQSLTENRDAVLSILGLS